MSVAQALDPVAAVKGAFADAVLDVVEFRGETTLVIAQEQIVPVAQYVRDTAGLVYNYLSDISDVDYYPDYNRPGRYGISYHLLSMLYKRRLRLKVYLQEDDPAVDSVTVVWPAANWLEREIHGPDGHHFQRQPRPTPSDAAGGLAGASAPPRLSVGLRDR